MTLTCFLLFHLADDLEKLLAHPSGAAFLVSHVLKESGVVLWHL